MTTEYLILCILAGIPAVIFMSIVFMFTAAAIYDAWYNYKYRTFVALQKDHTKPKRPAAK